jgi:aminopeptidase N
LGFREYGLTFDTLTISASYKRFVNTVVSHELAHMWFGNLVTCEWWDFTWLNEGFAEYISYLVSDEVNYNVLFMKVIFEMLRSEYLIKNLIFALYT